MDSPSHVFRGRRRPRAGPATLTGDEIAEIVAIGTSGKCGTTASDSPPDDAAGATPRLSALTGTIPNPFNPSTSILYDVAAAGPVRVAIYDAGGRRIRVVAEGPGVPGHYTVVWDGVDARGVQVPTGIYFVKLQAADAVSTRKIALLK